MSFEARNALMLARKIADKKAADMKALQKTDGGRTKAKAIPHGDPKREQNLAVFDPLRDENGKPMVLYHGTDANFSTFDPSKSGKSDHGFYGVGHYLTSNPELASAYSGYSNIKSISGDEIHPNQNVMPVYARLKNPYIWPENRPAATSREEAEKITHELKKLGHDGVIAPNKYVDGHEGKFWETVVFHPHQIKSATGNQGTFDPSNPDITKSEGGEVKRKINKVGLFSGAAEKARQLPSGSAPAAQLLGTLRNKGGIKAEELFNAGITDPSGKTLTPEWQSKGKITPEDLAAHFEGHLPEVEETVLGVAPKAIPYPEEYQKTEQAIIDKYKPEMEKHHNIYLDRNNEQHIRNAAQKHVEDLRDQMWAEIDRALPDREEHLAKAKPEALPTKYGKYALPGGENYREVLLKLPPKMRNVTLDEVNAQRKKISPMLPLLGQDEYNSLESSGELHKIEENPDIKFKSQHWDDPNVLAHIRMSDRTGPNGEKILHVEEVQSDWGQKGKKEGFDTPEMRSKLLKELPEGYVVKLSDYQRTGGPERYSVFDPNGVEVGTGYGRENAINSTLNDLNTQIRGTSASLVPSAPYVTSTEGWTDLALKRILKEAAEGGYDKVVWTPGDEQAKRYDLSKHIDRLVIHERDGKAHLLGYKDGNDIFSKELSDPKKELPELVGKDVAAKLMEQEPHSSKYNPSIRRELVGADLALGGEGMKGYYDNILPKRLQNLAQKHDKTAKVGYTDVMLPPSNNRGSNNPPMQAPGLTITPQMRDSILKGQEGYASGGEVEDIAGIGHNLPPRPRFAIQPEGSAPVKTPRVENYQFAQLGEGEANVNTLGQIFDKAIKRHLSLSEGERIANSQKAIKAIEPYLGKSKSGRPISILTQNSKLEKANLGKENEEPLRLPDGRGIETWGMSLYPDYKEGDLKLCPNSASCREACLGKTSGQFAEHFDIAQRKVGRVTARQRALNRTKAIMREPEAFAIRLFDDIESLRQQAKMNGNHLGIRANTLSDLPPRVFKSIIENQPNVSFYDYSKMGYKPIAENHHITHSSTGLTQEGVENPYTNWQRMRRFLDQGDNVAMVFTNSQKILPKFVHDQETNKKYAVVDGDSHDFRPMDIQPEGADGVIVGLTNKKSTGNKNLAHIASEGFFVKHDPKMGDTVHIGPQAKPKIGLLMRQKGETNEA